MPARQGDPRQGRARPVLRELAITRTGILCAARYEVVAHKRIGKEVGVTDEQNVALEDWKSATCFNDLQRVALAFTDEIVKLRRPTDATFDAIASRLTPAALIELQLSVGFYIMTSKFLETFGIDTEPATEAVLNRPAILPAITARATGSVPGPAGVSKATQPELSGSGLPARGT